jgi:hypothetical protein
MIYEQEMAAKNRSWCLKILDHYRSYHKYMVVLKIEIGYGIGVNGVLAIKSQNAARAFLAMI